MRSEVSNADILKEIQQLKAQLEDLRNGQNDQKSSVDDQGLEGKAELALHFAPIAIFIIREGLVQQPNAETYKIYGKSITNLVNRPFQDRVAEEDQERVSEYLDSVLQPDQSGKKCIHRIRTEDESERWLELTAVKLNDDPNDGLICYQVDVSESYLFKKNLGIYSEHLEESVKLRTNELRIALDKAEVANKLKDIFLQNMSHEFRTPIHQINSLSEIGVNKAINSLKKKADPLMEKMQDYFSDINNASQKLFLFILNLFNLSAMESGDIQFYFKPYNLAKALDTFQVDLKERLEEKNIKLVIEKCDAVVMVECDISWIKKALTQILINSIKYSPENSQIKMILKSQIEGNAEEAQDTTAIDIQDEGVGVPENELETIFSKFTQSSRTDDGSGGKGIGLAFCKQIVREHHGRIWAENRENKGFYIRIILPASQSDRIADSPKDTDINEIIF